MGRIVWAAAVVAGLSVAGCSGGDTGHSGSAPHEAGSTDHMKTAMVQSGDSAATKAYKMSMADMMSSAPAYTGDADVDFMQQMRVHHNAAIAMSEAVLEHGKDEETRSLAQAIIREQRREIAEIDAWLAEKEN